MQADTHTDPKGAAPGKTPAPVKKPRLDDDDAAAAPASAKKEKTLPTGLSRAIVIATLIFSVAFAAVELLRDRYGIAPVPNSPNSMAYRIDRLTGALQLCGAQQCSVVQTHAEE